MTPKIEIVLATRNKKKQREIINIFKALPLTPVKDSRRKRSVRPKQIISKAIRLLSLNDFPSLPPVKEDASTFKENAIKKARTAAAMTGKLALADDSGLEVEVLGGEPGVFSARYAGKQADYQENNLKLLRKLNGVPFSRRRATFRCFIVLANPEKIIKVVEGKCSGYILSEMRGKRGFGYDPLFYYPPYKKTFAELLPGEKNKVSHRYRALIKMARVIEKLVG